MKLPALCRHACLLAGACALLPAAAGQRAGAGLAHARVPSGWVGTWGTAAAGPPQPAALQTFSHQTLRLIVHTSIAGKQLRIRVSNERGSVPLRLGAAHLGLRLDGADIVPGSDRALTFSGFAAITIAPGALVLSDPVELDVPALADLAVSLYFPGEVKATTIHADTRQTNYLSLPGNFTATAVLPTQRILFSWPFLTEVDVQSAGSALVTLGDALTDGVASTRDANHRWTDFLAMRLAAMHDPQAQRTDRLVAGNRPVGVVNRGVSGAGPDQAADGAGALARFDRDVLATAGASQVVVLLGMDDIVAAGAAHPSELARGIDELVASYRQLIVRAHAKGLAIYGATMTPFEGTPGQGPATPAKELVRQGANQWIRTSAEFDAVIDFDRTVRDPAHPARLLPAFDSGDHLHPNDLGMQAMADAVPLALFHSRGFAQP